MLFGPRYPDNLASVPSNVAHMLEEYIFVVKYSEKIVSETTTRGENHITHYLAAEPVLASL